MKTFTFFSGLILISQLSSGQTDNWSAVTNNGFGFANQKTVPEVEVFNGKLFASTSPNGPGQAKLWYSDSGDPGSWVQVTSFSPPLAGDNSIHSFGTTTLGGGYIWLGTGNPSKGAIIYRSQDGISWIAISKRGFGTPALNGAVPHMVLFQGPGDTIPYIYAGAMSHGQGTPGQVWRTPYTNADSTQWTLLIDFTSVDTGVQTISYFCVWNNKLYFGTDDNNGGGQLWQTTDGVNFTKNTSVGGGFGNVNNHVLSSIEVFNDTMYITTTNMNGGQLWRSGDGAAWQPVTTDAFGKSDSVNELRSLRTSFGMLWLTCYTDTAVSRGTSVWRSSNGTDWIQSNIDGFGNPDNNGENAVTIGFGNFQYFGGPNYFDGGQVWRTDMSTKIIEPPVKEYSTGFFPNPVSDFAILDIGTDCFINVRISIYDITGRIAQILSPSAAGQYKIDKNIFTPGIYFYTVQTDQCALMKGKFVVE